MVRSLEARSLENRGEGARPARDHRHPALERLGELWVGGQLGELLLPQVEKPARELVERRRFRHGGDYSRRKMARP